MSRVSRQGPSSAVAFSSPAACVGRRAAGGARQGEGRSDAKVDRSPLQKRGPKRSPRRLKHMAGQHRQNRNQLCCSLHTTRRRQHQQTSANLRGKQLGPDRCFVRTQQPASDATSTKTATRPRRAAWRLKQPLWEGSNRHKRPSSTEKPTCTAPTYRTPDAGKARTKYKPRTKHAQSRRHTYIRRNKQTDRRTPQKTAV